MRIAQLLFNGANHYERKSQKIDFESLRITHLVTLWTDGVASPSAELMSLRAMRPALREGEFDIVHAYGSVVPSQPFRGLVTPLIASAPPKSEKLTWRAPVQVARRS